MPKRVNVKSRIVFFSFLLALIFLITSFSSGESLSPNYLSKNEIVEEELGKKIDKYLRQITPFGFSGALLVAKNGKIILNKGYGMAIRSENIPNSSETVFSTGSITKQFTAAGIMKLEMQRKLSANDPITKFFEKVPEDKAFGGDVVIPPSVVVLSIEKLRKFEGTYGLSSGGHLEADIENGRLAIKANGQDAINALLFPEKASPGLYKDLNRLSVSVFEAAIKGDYKPFENVLLNKERRLERVRELIEMRIRRYKERTGEIQEVKVFGTLPSDYGGKDTVMTQVQLKGEKGSIYFNLYWRNKMNIGVGRLIGVQEISVPFMLLSGNEFAGYHLGMAKNIRLGFSVDNSGAITGLTVNNPSGDLTAKKIK